MIIREMIEEDVSGLAKLYKQFWNEDTCEELMLKQFQTISQKGTHVILNAIQDRNIIGSVMGIICEELYGDCLPFMVVENMIVDQGYRRIGVGKSLITELEKVASNKKCTQIILVTERNRSDACNFYKSVGFNPDTHLGYKKKLL